MPRECIINGSRTNYVSKGARHQNTPQPSKTFGLAVTQSCIEIAKEVKIKIDRNAVQTVLNRTSSEPTGTQAANDGAQKPAAIADFSARVRAALKDAGYPERADAQAVNKPLVIFIIALFVAIQTMSYGPLAAALVELFPARVRYTSMSLPYHIGNGWFGGFLPTTAFAIVAATGNVYSGLWYPIAIAGATFIIGVLLLPETKDRQVHHFD